VQPLTLLFRKVVEGTEVPEDWKRANVTPIFKSDSKSKTSNYRPVSLTSQICKIFDAIIRDKMVEFLETHGLITDSQHGFRRGRSCLTNLLFSG